MHKFMRNVTRKSAHYVTAPIAGQYLHVGEDGGIDTTSCPHAATLFTNGDMAEQYCETIQKALPMQGGWVVRKCATYQPNVITGTYDITRK